MELKYDSIDVSSGLVYKRTNRFAVFQQFFFTGEGVGMIFQRQQALVSDFHKACNNFPPVNLAMTNHVIVTKEDLETAVRDFIPPSYPHEIELQNLVAVLECTSREMVPRRFRNLDRSKIVTQIRELKELLGEERS